MYMVIPREACGICRMLVLTASKSHRRINLAKRKGSGSVSQLNTSTRNRMSMSDSLEPAENEHVIVAYFAARDKPLVRYTTQSMFFFCKQKFASTRNVEPRIAGDSDRHSRQQTKLHNCISGAAFVTPHSPQGPGHVCYLFSTWTHGMPPYLQCRMLQCQFSLWMPLSARERWTRLLFG
jgi:hypothetical protein